MKGKVFKIGFVGFIAVALGTLTLCFPHLSAKGARDGLLMCGEIIIPSLFPFCVIALFCQKSGVLNLFAKILSPISKKLFHLTGEQFCAFLMSFTAGYPVGMKMIKALHNDGKISQSRAKRMALYSVNAGPAFIISAVGGGMLNDRTVGKYLLLAQAVATVLLAIIVEWRQCAENIETKCKEENLRDAFVESAADGASAVFGICGWVVLFSAFLSIINCGIFPTLFTKVISYCCEVTNGLYIASGNILVMSALLSFSGFSVHCQIYSLGKECAPKYSIFLACRLFHAAVSSAITYICLTLDIRTIKTLSNSVSTIRQNTSFTYASALALILMSVFLIISVSERKNLKYV